MTAPYEALKVWQEAHRLALGIYRETSKLPSHEKYSLATQLRRSAVSIPANIAEGNARGSIRENVRFCQVARGSLAETRYFLRLARDLGYFGEELYAAYEGGYDELGKILHFFISSMKGRRDWSA